MPTLDPKSQGHLESANGNGTARAASGLALPALLGQSAVAGPPESEVAVGEAEPLDVAGDTPDAGPAPSAAEPAASSPQPVVGEEETPQDEPRNRGAAISPDAPPGTTELMPRRRGSRDSSGSQPSRRAKAAQDPAKILKPKGARGAAHEERQEGPAWIARQAERARSLPARRQATPTRRPGYMVGTANLCRSCGLAVWLAGKDARGHWVKVNLDGAPHVCGAPLTGMGQFPGPLALPPGPQMPPPPVAPYAAAAPLGLIAQPVADQGRLWVERFLGVVALLTLVLLAMIPRDLRTGVSAPQGAPPGAAQQVAAATVAGMPAARPAPPKPETFSLGSTEDDVMATMGPPREIHEDRWWYGSSYVDFRNNRVVNFYNSIHGELKVKMLGASRTKPAYIAKGLSKDEVLNVQGTPTRLVGNRWYYGSSYVDFQNDRVADYFNGVLRELRLPTRSASTQ